MAGQRDAPSGLRAAYEQEATVGNPAQVDSAEAADDHVAGGPAVVIASPDAEGGVGDRVAFQERAAAVDHDDPVPLGQAAEDQAGMTDDGVVAHAHVRAALDDDAELMTPN